MNKLVLIIVAVAFSHVIVFSQGCLPEGIIFSGQEEIDNFQTNFPGCTEIIGDVLIWDYGTGVYNLIGLSVINKISGDLSIMATWSLENLEGLNNLDTIGGSLIIGGGCMWFGNYALTSLHGLENLIYIGGNLQISDNNLLTDMSGLNNLGNIGGFLGILYCSNLVNLNGLDNLSNIGGFLAINGTFSLTSLLGLDNLVAIGGGLYIGHPYLTGYEDCPEETPNLESITSLFNLTSIGGELQINNTQHLKSLSGLENINPASITNLYLTGNDSLFTCEVQSICNYLASPNGTVIITGNAAGCNNPEEVQQACLTTIEEAKTEEGIKINPNPSKDKITISVPDGVTIDEVVIYNQAGQKVLQGKTMNNTLDISKLQHGLYIIKLKTEQGKIKEKLIVQ